MTKTVKSHDDQYKPADIVRWQGSFVLRPKWKGVQRTDHDCAIVTDCEKGVGKEACWGHTNLSQTEKVTKEIKS